MVLFVSGCEPIHEQSLTCLCLEVAPRQAISMCRKLSLKPFPSISVRLTAEQHQVLQRTCQCQQVY